MEQLVTWEEASEIGEDYKEILCKEHHNHEIIMVNNILRWKATLRIQELIEESNLNNIIEIFNYLDINKNTEAYRKLYRDMGYSLSGYWEIFYWEANNPEAEEYLYGTTH
jgi:hypothetical protein